MRRHARLHNPNRASFAMLAQGGPWSGRGAAGSTFVICALFATHDAPAPDDDGRAVQGGLLARPSSHAVAPPTMRLRQPHSWVNYERNLLAPPLDLGVPPAPDQPTVPQAFSASVPVGAPLAEPQPLIPTSPADISSGSSCTDTDGSEATSVIPTDLSGEAPGTMPPLAAAVPHGAFQPLTSTAPDDAATDLSAASGWS